ncbi:LysR family transcriptional regulator [Pandoraea apista]|uniref:LysR family transcriptional regulator n=1 Tax=Pandoraea apista TaxID=93218 RepID=A0A0B5FCZ5_9BURK|nr:LysR family transcriptional regulator [Pandoraea apista]AJE97628.1 LysR family transcriptional regulator [Pandoraea apista]AKH71609.1 LysR family transcriptional regulator [Pandoraea apista]AKI63882.1 LysR family transcriptional regulator [Pandoraea apista]ALS67006.1 LysR family transcriptional regulator [Pandoraea apista]AVF42297.1 LysR family transcriptional regulator [Pandoraea apista]
MINLRRIDLNLLVTLDVLLAEQNVTRAAERLFMSQPAVSVHLAKLRDLLGDPLLLPGPRGMRPTARAEALREPLRDALESLSRAVAPATPFDPAKADLTWRIAATDYTESTIVLPLLKRLRADAPHTRLAAFDLTPSRLARQAEQGVIDIAFHTTQDGPEGLRRKALFTERYVLVGRRGHPKLKRRPSLRQFCELEHAIVSQDGGGFHASTDDALARLDATRRVVLSVPHFLFLRSALANTDLVAMAPERLVRDDPALQVTTPPVEVAGFEISMYWHERVHRDPAHRWLRECIASVV